MHQDIQSHIDHNIDLLRNELKSNSNSEVYYQNIIKWTKTIESWLKIRSYINSLHPDNKPLFKSGYPNVKYVLPTYFHAIAKALYEIHSYTYPKDYLELDGSCYFYGDNMGIQLSNDPSDYISLAVFDLPKELIQL